MKCIKLAVQEYMNETFYSVSVQVSHLGRTDILGWIVLCLRLSHVL